MIAVKDVLASSAWYERLLGCKNTHGGAEFGMLQDGKTVLLLLHQRHGDEHVWLREARDGEVGAGVCLYFRVDDLDAAFERAQANGTEILEPPHENPLAHQRELELRDPDGYYVTLCQ
jgi:predicted enzyme related to lactoylglutathione lyase